MDGEPSNRTVQCVPAQVSAGSIRERGPSILVFQLYESGLKRSAYGCAPRQSSHQAATLISSETAM
jgi:hypothetical protein